MSQSSHGEGVAVDRVLVAVDRLKDELIAAVSAAVRIPSINPTYPGEVYDEVVGGEGEVSRYMAGLYERIGCAVDLFAVEPRRENAVGVLKGVGGGRSLIFNGHVDVVPTGDPAAWASGDPFSGRIDADRIWGRGTTDMKGGIVAQAFAARAIREAGPQLRGDLILEAVVGEEMMEHEYGTTATLRRGYRADAAVVSEPSAPPDPLGVVPITPGAWAFSVTVLGKPVHSSMRGQTFRAGGLGAAVGVSAIDKGVYLFQALRQLEDEWGQSKQHPLFAPGHFSISPSTVVGGPRGVQGIGFVPAYMTMEYCCWYHPDDDPAQVQQEIEQHIARASELDPWLRLNPPTVAWKHNWPASQVDPAHPICRAVQEAHERAAAGTRLAGRPPIRGFAAVADASFLNMGGVPAIVYGPGDLRVAHADDEHILIDELLTACRTYAVLAMTWCGVDA